MFFPVFLCELISLLVTLINIKPHPTLLQKLEAVPIKNVANMVSSKSLEQIRIKQAAVVNIFIQIQFRFLLRWVEFPRDSVHGRTSLPTVQKANCGGAKPRTQISSTSDLLFSTLLYPGSVVLCKSGAAESCCVLCLESLCSPQILGLLTL